MIMPTQIPAHGKRPAAVDLSHHINTLSRSRLPSPLKDMLKYTFEPGMISFAGGLPHPSLFPIENIKAQVYAPSTDLVSGASTSDLMDISIPRIPGKPTDVNLSKAMQYSGAHGSAKLTASIREFTELVMPPGYEDYDILINNGSTDGWSKVVDLLTEPGDYILIEEHTFPPAQALWAPKGCKAAPIALDALGIIPADLERVLSNWSTDHPGVNQPHLLYTIPVGQNPTGATLTLERKQAIYDLCVEYDIIICEDDPYYFLQLPKYAPPIERNNEDKQTSPAQLLQDLVPTLLSLDYQGRVIRLDTFSKTLGPGNRLGYFIANPVFIERLARATEVVTQTPSGLSQAFVESIFTSWGCDGMLRWLGNLRGSYAVRRDWMCDSFGDHFALTSSADGLRVSARPKSRPDGPTMFTFAFPEAGMFMWLKLDLTQNAEYKSYVQQGFEDPEAAWTQSFWKQMIEEKILVTTGSLYVPHQGHGVPLRRETGVSFLRIAFSYESREDMEEGVTRMARAFEKSWAKTA